MYTYNPFTRKLDYYTSFSGTLGNTTFIGLNDTPSSYENKSLLISSPEGIDYIPKNVITISGSNISIGDADVFPVHKVYIKDDIESVDMDSPRSLFTDATFSGTVNYSLVNYVNTRIFTYLKEVDVSGMDTQPYGVKYGPWIYGSYTTLTSDDQIDFDTYYAAIIGSKVDNYYSGISANTELMGLVVDTGTKSAGTTELDSMFGIQSTCSHYNDLGTVGSVFGVYNDARNYSDNGSVGELYGVMIQAVDHGLGTGGGALIGEYIWAGLYPSLNDVFAHSDDIHAVRVQSICGYNSGSYTPSGVSTNNLYGIEVSIGTAGVNASVTNGYTLYVAGSPKITGDNSGTTENLYGLYIEDITDGSNKNYSIYSEGGENYFAGDLVVDSDLKYRSYPSVDHDVSGATSSGTTENVTSFGQALYVTGDGIFNLAKSDSDTTMPCIAMSTTNSNGNQKILTCGYIRDDSWNWNIGYLMYVSEDTAGDITQSVPTNSGSQAQVVGIATNSNIVYFNPSFVLTELGDPPYYTREETDSISGSLSTHGSTPSINGYYTGKTYTFTCDDSTEVGSPLYVKTTGNLGVASAHNGTSSMPGFFISVTSGTGDIECVKDGYVCNTSWAWTPGDRIYITTSSGLSNTYPTASGTWIQPVGMAVSSTTVVVDIDIELIN